METYKKLCGTCNAVITQSYWDRYAQPEDDDDYYDNPFHRGPTSSYLFCPKCFVKLEAFDHASGLHEIVFR